MTVNLSPVNIIISRMKDNPLSKNRSNKLKIWRLLEGGVYIILLFPIATFIVGRRSKEETQYIEIGRKLLSPMWNVLVR